MKCARQVSWMGKKENINADFMWKTEEKRTFGRTRPRWLYLLTYLLTHSMEQSPY
jgi:hypothetical protein